MNDLEQNMKALSALAILEKDSNGDVLPSWSYPEMSAEFEELLVSRSNLTLETIPIPFTYSRFKNEWVYILINLNEKQKVKNVVAFAVCVVTNDFNPEKYAELCKLLANLYVSSGDPVNLLECWLSVFMKGAFNGGQLGSFSASEHDPRKAFLVTSIKDIVRLFGEEVVLVWSALMMKKRIVVYSEKLGLLLKLIRGFPLFVWHRQNWSILRPYMATSDQEIADLKSVGVYCAGFKDDSIRDREDLYDLLVDVNNRSISVASHAKADFALTPVHKDIAEFLVTSAENPEVSDQEIIKGLAVKTKDLLSKLERLKTENEDGTYIDYNTLKNTKLPANMDRFLYAVATAEGMTKI